MPTASTYLDDNFQHAYDMLCGMEEQPGWN